MFREDVKKTKKPLIDGVICKTKKRKKRSPKYPNTKIWRKRFQKKKAVVSRI